MALTLAQLKQIMPDSSAYAGVFLAPLDAAMVKYAIHTPKRMAAFLAQIAHESGQLCRLQEDLSYSARGLLQVFPRYFTAKSAEAFAHQPARIANRVYANRMGNGGEASGDGWHYRGRGLFQCTGKSEYQTCGHALGLNLVANPDLLLHPEHASQAAASFWAHRKLNTLADAGEFLSITRAINGGENGEADRHSFYVRALKVLEAK